MCLPDPVRADHSRQFRVLYQLVSLHQKRRLGPDFARQHSPRPMDLFLQRRATHPQLRFQQAANFINLWGEVLWGHGAKMPWLRATLNGVWRGTPDKM